MTFVHRQVFCLLAATIIAIAPHSALAQTEGEPLRLVVPCAAGTPNDLMARIIAQALAENLGRRVDIENIIPNADNSGGEAGGATATDGRTAAFRLRTCLEDEQGLRTAKSASE